jgi:molecular chaperone GrpE (heat shock protein)
MNKNILRKTFQGKDPTIVTKAEPEKVTQNIPEQEEKDAGFFKFNRDFTTYCSGIDKLAITLMEIKRELVRQEQLLCQRYEKLAEERDQLRASNEHLIHRILIIKNDLEENAQKLEAKSQKEILQVLQADLWAAVEKEGVSKIPVTVGSVYDPLTCVAVPEQIRNDAPEGTIVREISPGYTCKSKKLISAKVGVTKKGEVVKK